VFLAGDNEFKVCSVVDLGSNGNLQHLKFSSWTELWTELFIGQLNHADTLLFGIIAHT
jgi:hypothetical protein